MKETRNISVIESSACEVRMIKEKSARAKRKKIVQATNPESKSTIAASFMVNIVIKKGR